MRLFKIFPAGAFLFLLFCAPAVEVEVVSYNHYLNNQEKIRQFEFSPAGTLTKDAVNALIRHNLIERHVRETPASVEKSLRKLAKYLVKPARNDFEKIFAFYCWITNNINYDVKAFFNRKFGIMLPSQVLNKRLAVCGGFARLFDELVTLAGLKSVIVTGTAKGWGYQAEAGRENSIKHAWNAVKIKNGWYLVDCTWGAGNMAKKSFQRRVEYFYFLPPAEELIYSHLPEEDRLQFTETPLLPEDFINQVYVRPKYFELGVQAVTHHAGFISTDSALTTQLKVPDNILITARVHQNGRELPVTLSFAQQQGNVCTIQSFFPQAGDFELKIYGKSAQAEAPTKAEYDPLLTYRVKAEVSPVTAHYFPEPYSTFYHKNVYLYSPLNGKLKPNSTCHFKVMVPGAKKVAVVNQKKWNFLIQKNNIFEGDVPIAKGPVRLVANFKAGNQFAGLVEYRAF